MQNLFVHTLLNKVLSILFHSNQQIQSNGIAIGGFTRSVTLLNAFFQEFALKLASQAQFGRMSKKRIMFSAALNPEFLLKILFDPLK